MSSVAEPRKILGSRQANNRLSSRIRSQQPERDAVRQRKSQRTYLATPHRGQRSSRDRAVIYLFHAPMHALTELGQLQRKPLADKQITTELLFKPINSASELSRGDATSFRGHRETLLDGRSQKIFDLLHFHGASYRPTAAWSESNPAFGRLTKIPFG
jgi:hypothetical protein